MLAYYKRSFIVMFVLFVIQTIAACTVIIGYPMANNAVPEVKISGCSKVVLPKLKTMPDVPLIPDSVANNKEQVEDILVRNIDDLREHIRYLNKEYRHAIDDHLKSCP